MYSCTSSFAAGSDGSSAVDKTILTPRPRDELSGFTMSAPPPRRSPAAAARSSAPRSAGRTKVRGTKSYVESPSRRCCALRCFHKPSLRPSAHEPG